MELIAGLESLTAESREALQGPGMGAGGRDRPAEATAASTTCHSPALRPQFTPLTQSVLVSTHCRCSLVHMQYIPVSHCITRVGSLGTQDWYTQRDWWRLLDPAHSSPSPQHL